jgi:hypothetical protein
MEDVSAEVAGLISSAKVFGASENIRHGKYKFVIRRMHAQKIEMDQGQHRFAFVEVSPYESLPNPQTEGDRVDYVSPTSPGTGPLKDDGTKPNPVGSYCALKVDFDGAGGRSAGSNIKDCILALFGKKDGQIPDSQVNETWIDLARIKDVKKGEPVGFNPTTNTVIIADKDKIANPACGMVIACRTIVKKKKKPNDKGAYITKLVWECISPVGMGENAPEMVAKRRAEIEPTLDEESEEETAGAPAAPASNPYAAAPQAPGTVQTSAAPQPPAPPVAPSTTVAPPPFVPMRPWEAHPNPAYPGFYWSNPANGGNNAVKSEADLRAGK